MRKAFTIFLFLIIFTIGFSSMAFAVPDVYGNSFIVIDGKTGQVLFGKDYEQTSHPASTTKILTTIIALEKADLNDKVTISKNVPLVEGTKVYLREGEKVKLEDLLFAMMVHSANDAALAVAEHISGSQEEFAKLMNNKAQEIGATNSNFTNPHGLTDDKHLSTAHDLALIGRYAMENQKFRELAASKVFDWEGEEWENRLINKNSFLWRMDEGTGIKPGYTSKAKYTLVASAKKDGKELICTILGSTDNRIWDDAQAILEYGFANFENLSLTKIDSIIATIKVTEDQEVNLAPVRSLAKSISTDEEALVEKKVILKDYKLPIKEGDILGELVIYINGQEEDRIGLKAMENIKKTINWQDIVIKILAGTFLLQILIRLIRRIQKRKRKKQSMFGSSRRISSYRF